MAKYTLRWPRELGGDVAESWCFLLDIDGELPRVGDTVNLEGVELSAFVRSYQLDAEPPCIDALRVAKVEHRPGYRTVVHAVHDENAVHDCESRQLIAECQRINGEKRALLRSVAVAVTGSSDVVLAEKIRALLAEQGFAGDALAKLVKGFE